VLQQDLRVPRHVAVLRGIDRMSRAARLLCLLSLAACTRQPRVRIDYTLAPTLQPADVVRVETTVRVAPGDPRMFTADETFRVVAPGVGYEVRDFDGTGVRSLLISHDSTLGYTFTPSFSFTLLPPVGEAPPLVIQARAIGASQQLGESMLEPATFGENGEVALTITDARCGAAACPPDQSCCSGACTPTDSDRSNCGGCGMSCGTTGDSCSGSLCRCGGGSACTTGQTCCAGVGCADTTNDPFNCGGCGNQCAGGETCVGGQCKCGTQTCDPTQICCGGATPTCATSCSCGSGSCTPTDPVCCSNNLCVNTKNDDDNCGNCGNKCVGGTSCGGGHCLCGGHALCTGSDVCCGTACANLDDDVNNCGGCGIACPTGYNCHNRQCVCGSSGGGGAACTELCCDGVCTNPNNVDNCGMCGNKCQLGESCQNGMACECPGPVTTMTCLPGQTCCGGQGCFDIANDPLHCGPACTPCAAGDSCVMGNCMTTCGGVACTPSQRCCGGHCVSLDQNCSACGDVCATMCCPATHMCQAPMTICPANPP
jgi:hypothetical protein